MQETRSVVESERFGAFYSSHSGFVSDVCTGCFLSRIEESSKEHITLS